MFDGSYETFEMLRRADTVKILAILTEDEAKQLEKQLAHTTEAPAAAPSLTISPTPGPKLIVTKQEQPRKDLFYDYPGGRTDPEDPDELAAAKRELLEETGLSFRNWKLIKVEQPFNKIDWLVYTFIATGLESIANQSLDAGEKIEVEAMTFPEVKQLILSDDARYMRFKELSDRINLDDLSDLPALYAY